MTSLEHAILLATQAHAGQVDKAGQPYILHPLRVMLAVGTEQGDVPQIVAVLHDVLEDTTVTLAGLQVTGHFNEVVLTALDAITRRHKESYAAYIDRVRDNRVARLVKLRDLEDNLGPSRLGVLTGSLIDRYARAHARLRWVA